MTEQAPTGEAGDAFAALPLVAAPLVWIPQAALIAGAIGGMAAGAGAAAAIPPALGLLLLAGLRAGLEYLGGRLVFARARRRLTDARIAAVARLAAASPLDQRRAPSGLAASVLAEEAEAITPWLARFRVARLRAAVVPVAILLAILPLSWLAALALAVAAPAIPVFMALIGWRAQAASARRLGQAGDMNAFLLDRLRGLAAIRGLGAVEATAQRLRAEAEAFREGTMAVLRIAFLSSAVLELFAALGVAMAAVWVGFHLLGQIGFGAWGGRLTLPEGVFILLLAPAFFEPLRELSAVWHDRAAGEAALAALEGVGRDETPLLGAPAPAAPLAAAPALRVRGLRFGHAGRGEAALDGVSFDLAAGQSLALVGPSGSGKSTLLALIAGLAPAEAGEIVVGGLRLDAETAPVIRAGAAWIGQAPHVFAGGIAGNIRLGRGGIGPDAVAAALRFARLDRAAAARGTAPVGEGGLGLSGGEALRLAVARAAAAPEARLILADEPTAHLDAETAAEIAEMLVALGRGRTLVVATHDPRLAARLDRRLDLTEGRLEAAA